MFEAQDRLADRMAELEFPAPPVKVRVTIAGLAVARLDQRNSRLHFLRDVDHHKLTMTVTGKERTGAIVFPRQNFTIKKKDLVSITAANLDIPSKVKTDGPRPLEFMVNLQDIHRGPLDITKPEKTSIVDISGCAFYTVEFFGEQLFELVEEGSADSPIRRNIGSVMGGNISCTVPNSRITITSDSLENGRLPLEGTTGAGNEIVYEIVFNNNCEEDEEKECKKQVQVFGGTDFGFYYKVLKEQLRPERKFLLKRRTGIVSDVAACNPVILSPKVSQYNDPLPR